MGQNGGSLMVFFILFCFFSCVWVYAGVCSFCQKIAGFFFSLFVIGIVVVLTVSVFLRYFFYFRTQICVLLNFSQQLCSLPCQM